MTAQRKVKAVLAGIIAVFAAATLFTSIVIGERQEVLRGTSRYNVAWLAGQATTEFARFGERVSAYAAAQDGVDADEIRLRFDILLNRLALFEDGDFRAFVASKPENAETIRAFADAMPRIEPLVEAIERPGSVARLREIAVPLEGRLARLAAAANRYGGELAADDQQDLLSLHRTFSALAVGLIACGVALIGMLGWHNHLLTGAHRNLNTLAADLAHASEQRNAALNNMSQGLCLVDKDGRLTICNRRLLELFDLSTEIARAGRPIDEVFRMSPLFAGGPTPLGDGHARLIRGRQAGAYLHELPDGRTLAISHQPLSDGGWVATYEDITERRRAEARIAHLAHHDVLTGLPNRAQFLNRLEEALTRTAAQGETAAVVALDLDRFKAVNDSLGHPIGDKLLCAVAERLLVTAGDADLVARFGGDEFAILQVGREQPRDADALARQVVEAIAEPFVIDGNEIVVGTSVGVSVAPGDGMRSDGLLKNADMALYRAKAEGRGAYRFFEPAMDAQLQVRHALEADLRYALQREEFELYYQALVELRTGTVVGHEALLRWIHPGRGTVSPAVFIPVAEEMGLISAIGDWVLREACREAATWPAGLKVAVNLSSAQFRGRGLVPTIVSALAASGLAANRLELEITESILLDDDESTLATLHRLRTLGARIALDDFGTGFASLSYLRKFPFDKIKIDRSFVKDSERPESLAIVRSVASLAASLGMSTTAEGIETLDQCGRVREAACTEGQGFLFARPKPARELAHAARYDLGPELAGETAKAA